MSAERKSGNESPQSKRKRPRRWLQFSIRTLLIVISLVAASLAWLTRPEYEERLLSGGAGKVRQEYRQDENDRKVRHGRWELTGRHGGLMVRGRYADDRPQGRWTAYHASGRALLRGVCVGGAPVGPWKAMFPDGRLQADFEFAALPSQASLVGNRPGVVETCRSGPMRVWWPNGQLRLEGQFADDFEEGVWSFYNKDGHKIASGPFRAGRRHGVWTFWDDRGKNAEQVQYVFGRSLPDAPALVKSLTDQLGTGALAQRVTAARKLESLGPLGVPSLVACLKSSDKTTRGLALRRWLKSARTRLASGRRSSLACKIRISRCGCRLGSRDSHSTSPTARSTPRRCCGCSTVSGLGRPLARWCESFLLPRREPRPIAGCSSWSLTTTRSCAVNPRRHWRTCVRKRCRCWSNR